MSGVIYPQLQDKQVKSLPYDTENSFVLWTPICQMKASSWLMFISNNQQQTIDK